MAHMKPVFAMQQFDPNQTLADRGVPGAAFGSNITESRRFARTLAPRPVHKSKNQPGLSADQKHSFAAPDVRPHNASTTRCRMPSGTPYRGRAERSTFPM